MPRLFLTALSAALVAAAGCAKAPKNAPPNKEVEQAVKAALPPFLTLESLKTEPVPVGSEKTKVNFSAVLSPKEDLFIADGELEGDSQTTLLKPVMKAGARANVYGFVMARRIMEKWEFEQVEIVSGGEQFGRPRGAFGPLAVVAGSPEAEAALRRVKAEQEAARLQMEEREKELERLRREKEAEDERARQEMEARRKQELEALKERALKATTPGASYTGFLISEDQRQPLRLVFTERKGFVIKAEASNPLNPAHRQSFTGELVFNPDDQEGSRNNRRKFYPVMLSPVAPQDYMSGRWNFYRSEGWLGLDLTEEGLEGAASIGGIYRVRLQRDE